MRIWVWPKTLVIYVVLVLFGGYAVFASDWFQKKIIYPWPYESLVHRYAVEYDVSPYLVAGVILAESKFLTQARSPKGALGLMQIMPETAVWIAGQLHEEECNPASLHDPQTNLQLGTWYLAYLNKEFGANETLVLAAYNGGPGNVRQWINRYGWAADFADVRQIPFAETREYVTKVRKNKHHYEQLYGR